MNELCLRRLASLVVLTCSAIGLGLCFGAHMKLHPDGTQPLGRTSLVGGASQPVERPEGGALSDPRCNDIADTPGRSAADFVGLESAESHAPRLSEQVRPRDRELIVAAWKAGDFAKVAQLVRKLSDLEDRRVLWPALLDVWVQLDPVVALDFVGTLEQEVERRELLGNAVRLWTAHDLSAASSWVNALPAHRDYDPAVAAIALCPGLYQQNPDAALSWAETVIDPKLRWEAVCTVAQEWAGRDATAAENYLVNCRVLTPEERTQVIAHVRRWSVAVK